MDPNPSAALAATPPEPLLLPTTGETVIHQGQIFRVTGLRMHSGTQVDDQGRQRVSLSYTVEAENRDEGFAPPAADPLF